MPVRNASCPPYLPSPTIGWPIAAMWTRSWWVRPVSGCELDPGGAVAGAVDHAVAGRGRLAVLARRRASSRRRCPAAWRAAASISAVVDVGHADDQRPVDLLRRAAREALGEERRAARGAGDQQDARGVLVEPVDQARARLVSPCEGVEQAVDMAVRAGAALGGEAGRLVEHDRGVGPARSPSPRPAAICSAVSSRAAWRLGLRGDARRPAARAGPGPAASRSSGLARLPSTRICPVRAQRETVAKPTCGRWRLNQRSSRTPSSSGCDGELADVGVVGSCRDPHHDAGR